MAMVTNGSYTPLGLLLLVTGIGLLLFGDLYGLACILLGIIFLHKSSVGSPATKSAQRQQANVGVPSPQQLVTKSAGMGMFDGIVTFDFAMKRTPKQALGFYIAAFVIFGIITITYIIIAGPSSDISKFEFSGTVASFIIVAILGYLILSAKKALKDTNSLVIFLLAVVLSLLTIFLGLIPLAYLTTKDKHS